MNSHDPSAFSQDKDELPSLTGSKMGAEPPALPDDPVSPAAHPLSRSGEPVALGLRPSEVLEQQHPGGEPGSEPGDTQKVGEVGTIIDQNRKSPDLSRTQ